MKQIVKDGWWINYPFYGVSMREHPNWQTKHPTGPVTWDLKENETGTILAEDNNEIGERVVAAQLYSQFLDKDKQ